MKTFSHSLQYLAEFFLEWEIFQTKVVEKIKTRILCSVTFFQKIVPFVVECRKTWWSQRGCRWQYGEGVACWISKATRAQAHASARAPTPSHNTHTHNHTRAPHTRTLMYVILIAFPRQKLFRERSSMLSYTYISTSRAARSETVASDGLQQHLQYLDTDVRFESRHAKKKHVGSYRKNIPNLKLLRYVNLSEAWNVNACS